jgi:hypothetical protein
MKTWKLVRPRTVLAAFLGPLFLALCPGVAAAQGAAPTPGTTPAAPAPPTTTAAPDANPYGTPPDAASPAPATAPDGAGTPAPATPAPAAPAPAEATPTAQADARAAEAEALALEQQFAQETAGSDEYKLDVYGFADFTYGLSVERWEFGPPNDSFAVGNLNVYLAANLGGSFKSLAEVRFTYLPHGSTTSGPTAPSVRTDTTSGDYTDLNRPVRPGGIIIERAHLEYEAHPLLNIRAGHFLTPYGIWNVDHGTPVIVGVRRPFIVGESLLPESQTGLEIYGTHLLEPVKLGYHLTLSNGRGPIDTYQDLNKDKAVGGRLFAHADTGLGAFTLGVSGYRGRYTDKSQQFTLDAQGRVSIPHPVTADYKELSLATDLKWELDGFLLQGEAIMNDVVYGHLRPTDPFAVGGPPGFVPDSRKVGVYGLTGYRFAFGGIMPFAGIEYYDTGRTDAFAQAAAAWGGINARPTPRVVLKAQYSYGWFPEDSPLLPENSHYNAVDFQAAWSF